MNKNEMFSSYRNATTRLLLLDYDGVLVPIMPTPEQAAPTERTYDLLKKLTSDPRNTCVIISGRPRETLEAWLGALPLSLVAEHGLWRKEEGGAWKSTHNVTADWKYEVRKVMSMFVKELSGSFIEEKDAGLVFHYRAVENADEKIRRLINDMEELIAKLPLRLMHGKKIVEVIPAGIDKGTAAEFWINREEWDFIVGVGDDVTDESLFEVLPIQAFSVKVGNGLTTARLSVPSQSAFFAFLETLSK